MLFPNYDRTVEQNRSGGEETQRSKRGTLITFDVRQSLKFSDPSWLSANLTAGVVSRRREENDTDRQVPNGRLRGCRSLDPALPSAALMLAVSGSRRSLRSSRSELSCLLRQESGRGLMTARDGRVSKPAALARRRRVGGTRESGVSHQRRREIYGFSFTKRIGFFSFWQLSACSTLATPSRVHTYIYNKPVHARARISLFFFPFLLLRLFPLHSVYLYVSLYMLSIQTKAIGQPSRCRPFGRCLNRVTSVLFVSGMSF